MRLIVCCFFIILISCSAAIAQQDSLTAKQNNKLAPYKPLSADSLRADSIKKEDRLQFISDSIAFILLIPDSLRENEFTGQVHKDNLSYIRTYPPAKPDNRLKSGLPRNGRAQWVIAVIIGLLIYTALLNIFLGNDIKSVIQSFYNKNALSQIDKEGGLINSWAFIGLFILFSLALGMVLYQYTSYKDLYYDMPDFQLFVALSAVIALLFTLKFLVLKVLGLIFDINGLVSQYIAILNLTYFNIAFVLLIVAVCFSLISSSLIPILLNCTLGLILIIFAWQYLRNSVNIISNFRFHKFYLFIYLCALEICPILILIKALNI